jgi:hypothetical protein
MPSEQRIAGMVVTHAAAAGVQPPSRDSAEIVGSPWGTPPRKSPMKMSPLTCFKVPLPENKVEFVNTAEKEKT